MKDKLLNKVLMHLLETSQVGTIKQAVIRQKIIDEIKEEEETNKE